MGSGEIHDGYCGTSIPRLLPQGAGSLKSKLETWFDAALSRSPAQPVFHWRASRQLTVLAYHGIDDPDRFEQHLDYLLRRMCPVSKEEALAAIAGQRGLPKRAVLITFDDGHRSLLDLAMPLLRDRGLPAIVFVIAGLLDTNIPYWWVEAKELVRRGGTANGFPQLDPDAFTQVLKNVTNKQRLVALAELRQTVSGTRLATPQLRCRELTVLESAGVSVGNHSFTHPCLPNCSTGEIVNELSQAHEVLSAALGHAPQVFSYPNGDEDERVSEILLTMGYRAAFLFDHRISPFPPPEPLRISRLRVNSDTSLDRFRIIVSGLHPALHHGRGRG